MKNCKHLQKLVETHIYKPDLQQNTHNRIHNKLPNPELHRIHSRNMLQTKKPTYVEEVKQLLDAGEVKSARPLFSDTGLHAISPPWDPALTHRLHELRSGLACSALGL